MPKGRKKHQGFTKAGTDLLNFHFERRDVRDYGTPSRPRPSYHYGNENGQFKRLSENSGTRQPLNREAYVAGRFKFCLKGDGTACGLVGEDKVSWNQVERVIVETDGEAGVSCPICLSPSRAPRMTNCGHIFCWLCIKRMFFHTKEVFEHCPLCFAFIRLQDIRSVTVHHTSKNPVIGDVVRFQLVHRFASCIVCTPVDQARGDAPLPCFDRLPSVPEDIKGRNLYSRLYLESNAALIVHLKEEQVQLVEALEEAKSYNDELGMLLLQQMAAELGEAQARVETSLQSTQVESLKVDDSAANDKSEQVVYLYQFAGNGKNVFLHPFSVRCLLNQYGDMSSFPTELKGARVVDVEQVVASPESKKRYPFLSHIPLSATVTFVEVDLNKWLDERTKEEMGDQIKKRQVKRMKRRKARRRAEKGTQSSVKQDWLEQVATFDSNLVRQNIDSGYEFPDLPTGPVDIAPTIGSFATVVNSNGYFPALGESTVLSRSASPPKSSWVNSIESAPRSPWNATQSGPKANEGAETQPIEPKPTSVNPPAEKKSSSGHSNRKKGKGRKVSLYSNSHHRVYH